MSELTYDTESGKLVLRGWCVDTMGRAAELGRELARAGEVRDEWIEFEGAEVRLTARPARGPARVAHLLGRRNHAVRVPAIREYVNLSWLIERHFQTVMPLSAGVFLRRGAPVFQYLLTRRELEVSGLESALRDAPAPERRSLAAELARELGRMHALGFVHGNLDAASVLVRPPTEHRRLVFLKPWAGGPRPQRRPCEADLARVLGTGVFETGEVQELLADYHAQREAQGSSVPVHASAGRLRRERTRLERAHGPSNPAIPWHD